MKAMSLTEFYHALSQWSKECMGRLSGNDRNKFNHLITELDTIITVTQRTMDKDDINNALETISRLKSIKWPRFREEHLSFRDFLNVEEFAILFDVKPKTLQSREGNINRKGKSIKSSYGGLTPAETESIEKMSDEDFDRELELSARVRQIESVRSPGLPGVQVARDVLINKRNRQQKEVGQMWALAKDFLAWMTGVFIPAATKKFSNTRPPFDVKVLVSEVLGEEYTELKRKYQEVKPREDTPWEVIEKKAKRRGKLKPTRKIEEREAKLLKAGSSSAPPPIENAESLSTPVSELDLKCTDAD